MALNIITTYVSPVFLFVHMKKAVTFWSMILKMFDDVQGIPFSLIFFSISDLMVGNNVNIYGS